MRTTINLPDDLIAQAKRAALDANTTLSDVIVEALREALAKRKRRALRKDFGLITYGTGGMAPGVDLNDLSALL